MCGIVGALSFKSSSFRITDNYMTRMRDVMAHRGPDGAGTWVSRDGRVGLGHRRLAIIDLSSAATQPMCNEDGTVWVVFNGEIYNHAEIRAELQLTGRHQWKTDHSDTEVIAHAFEQWGIDCISRFRGMFAIAIWDSTRNSLWLIRDRIGIKPVYYSIHNGRITFASEIKALLQDPEQRREVNEQAFYDYLSFRASPAPMTLFDGIYKLPGGTWLRVNDDGHVLQTRYWDVLDYTQPLTNISEEEITARLIEELRTAVKLRKISDVPVGVFLSGGIDSSVNTALFSEGDSNTVKTFSIGYEGDNPSYRNELEYARRMATFVRSDHHELLIKESDFINFLPEMVRLQDEPLADPVCVPLYFVSKLAKQNDVTVCQVGEGSDELFWGYPTWRSSLNLQRWNDRSFPHSVKRLMLAALRTTGRGEGFKYELLRRGTAGQPIFWGGSEGLTEACKHAVLSPRLANQFRDFTSWETLAPIRERFTEKAWEASHLNWMTYLDLNLRLPELLLMRVDKMSMAVSLEARVPFLDHKFVELSMSIPESVKTKNNTLKYILKKAVRGVIPDDLIERKKQGFGVPMVEWSSGHLGSYAQKKLNRFVDDAEFLNKEVVKQLFDRNRSREIWILLNFALWWEEYIACRSVSNADCNSTYENALMSVSTSQQATA